MAKAEKKYPHLRELHARIAMRPRIVKYLASERRLPFNEYGIFRHYPELDLAAPRTTKNSATKNSAKKKTAKAKKKAVKPASRKRKSTTRKTKPAPRRAKKVRRA